MILKLPSLPYALNALEPFLTRQTLAVHHGRHHSAYVDKTRMLVSDSGLSPGTLEEIIRFGAGARGTALYNAAAQAWNHGFYWRSMRPGGGGDAHGLVADLIEANWGSQCRFNQAFVSVAGDHFGSGWGWLVFDGSKLKILSTQNADTPLTTSDVPILTIDLWEHAYYLDYQHRRLDYIANFLAHLVDWEFAIHNLERALGGPHPPRLADRRSHA